MNLDITWSAPSPIPGCGYKALYRRKSDPTYTEIDTSGNTLTIGVSAPASFEGSLVSNCCSDNTSSGAPFGVNGYSPVTVSASISINGNLNLTITSLYANSYDTIISGSFNVSGTPTVFSKTYSAGNTTQSYVLGSSYNPISPITSMFVSSVSPIFNKGGQLQQFDIVNTPPYFMYYWVGNISGSTSDGSPLSLPSFTLDAFNPTEIAPDGSTIIAGSLNFSYIVGSIPAGSFNSITLEVFDPSDSSLVGSTVVSTSPVGIREGTIILTKTVSALTSSTAFTMKAIWPDLTQIDSRVFYLP